MRIAEPFAADDGRAGASGALLRWVKPQLTVVLRGGESFRLAPAGAPNPRAPLVVGVVVGASVLVALVVLLLWIRRRA